MGGVDGGAKRDIDRLDERDRAHPPAAPAAPSSALSGWGVGAPSAASLIGHLARCSVEDRKAGMEDLSGRVGNRRVARMIMDAGSPARHAVPTLARAPQPSAPPAQRKSSARLERIARDAIEELDGRRSKKALIASVLSAAKLEELPAFAAILKAAAHETHGDHFIFLAYEMEESWGSREAISILQMFADAGVDVTKQVDTYSLQPLAAVAKFKSLLSQVRALVASGELSQADTAALKAVIAEAESALRGIESEPRQVGGQVKVAGGVAGAAAMAWRTAAVLAADNLSVIGVADDVAIPFVIIGAAALSAIAIFTDGPKPRILDYGPVTAKVQAALRQMTDLVGISKALEVQGDRARGQLLNVARHLARLFAVASVGGQPPEEDPKKNDRDDNHWWKEIKASLQNYFQAFKGASRKQVMRELLKKYTPEQIAEIELFLGRAEAKMAEQLGRPLIPPP